MKYGQENGLFTKIKELETENKELAEKVRYLEREEELKEVARLRRREDNSKEKKEIQRLNMIIDVLLDRLETSSKKEKTHV